MMPLKLDVKEGRPLTILCLGAHSDDIEIGCGATILRLLDEYPGCRIHWVVFSAIEIRKAEAQSGASQFAGADRIAGLHLHDFADGFMPYHGDKVKRVFEELKPVVSPDLIFTHRRDDAHQDHRLLSELTWNTFRNHFILEYEIPKYDGDMGAPAFFVSVSKAHCEQKVDRLISIFQSQAGKHWFDPDLFRGLMRIRGMECNASSGFAEAFYCRKVSL